MKSIFELKQEINEFREITYPVVKDTFDYYNTGRSELLEDYKHINHKIVSYVCKKAQLEDAYRKASTDVKGIVSDELKEMLTNTDFQANYSIYSVISWIRRAYRNYREHSEQLYRRKTVAAELLSILRELYQELEQHTYTQVDKLIHILDSYREDLLSIKAMKFDFHVSYSSLESLFTIVGELETNKLLSLLTLDKTKHTQQVINELPDTLNEEQITRLVFADMIEDDQDSYLKEMIFEQIMKFRAENKEAADIMDRNLGLDMIPSVTITFDEYGEVDTVTPNKPNLRLV